MQSCNSQSEIHSRYPSDCRLIQPDSIISHSINLEPGAIVISQPKVRSVYDSVLIYRVSDGRENDRPLKTIVADYFLTGKKLRFPLGTINGTNFCVHNDILFFDQFGGAITAMNTSGEIIWQYGADGLVYAHVHAIAKGKVIVGSLTGISILDEITGKVLLEFKNPATVSADNNILVTDDFIYVQDFKMPGSNPPLSHIIKISLDSLMVTAETLLEKEKIIDVSGVTISGDYLFSVIREPKGWGDYKRQMKINVHSANDLSLISSFYTTERVSAHSFFEISDGNLIWLHEKDSLRAIQITTGETVWAIESKRLEGNVPGRLQRAGDYLFQRVDDNILILNSSTGKLEGCLDIRQLKTLETYAPGMMYVINGDILQFLSPEKLDALLKP